MTAIVIYLEFLSPSYRATAQPNRKLLKLRGLNAAMLPAAVEKHNGSVEVHSL
jgi:hypothetical protein